MPVGSPSYDVRSGSLAEPISIIYKANIFQNTKEEWKNVELSLSSSNPSTGSVAPHSVYLLVGLRTCSTTLQFESQWKHCFRNRS